VQARGRQGCLRSVQAAFSQTLYPPRLPVPQSSGNLGATGFADICTEGRKLGQQALESSKTMIIDGNATKRASHGASSSSSLSGPLSRRSFLAGSAVGLGALALGGCASSGGMSIAEAQRVYGPVPQEKFPIPAVDVTKVDPKYFRATVQYSSREEPGTIIVDPANYYVYRIEGDGMATRYGANVGRDGFRWNGDAYVGRKGEWAVWTPPREMIKRQPEAAQWARGMPGGLDNRSAPGRSISTRTAATRSTRSMRRATRNRSARA
jgi:lipoprotein-anchoring transpeptidase ErfK/SrfK